MTDAEAEASENYGHALELADVLNISVPSAEAIIDHPDVFVMGLRQAGGPVDAVIERNPLSPRSATYRVGRNIGTVAGS